MSAISRLAIPRRKKVFKDKLLPHGDGLPFWSTLDLDEKLPVVPSPRGSYTLYTTSIGQPKYRNKQTYDFDLSDPLCHVQPLEYDSLHDPYLKQHFQKKSRKHHLVKNGLLTNDERIVCSLKEFNKFREYMRYRKATELSYQRRREQANIDLPPRRTQSERIERNSDACVGQNECLVDEIRRKETDALIRREKLKRVKEEKYQKKLVDDWKDRKLRQEHKIKRINDLMENDRIKREDQVKDRDNTRQRKSENKRLESAAIRSGV